MRIPRLPKVFLCLFVASFGGLGFLDASSELYVDSLSDSGVGSLRDQVANSTPGDEVIVRVNGVIQLLAPIEIDHALSIRGVGSASSHVLISAGGTRLFKIGSGFEVLLSRLTLQGGNASRGAAVESGANLTLERIVFRGNEATSEGGAVYQSGGKLRVDRCYFIANHAGGNGGAIAVYDSPLVVVSTGFGGILEGEFVGNSSGGAGGAIWSNGPSVEVQSSTFFRNESLLGGGALSLLGAEARGINLTLVDNVGNSAVAGHLSLGAGASFVLADSLVSGDGPENSLPAEAEFFGNNLFGSIEDLGLGQMTDNGGMSPTFSLKPTSPAIDGSTSSLLFSTGFDQRGLSRLSDGNADGGGDTADVGAFEIQHYKISSLEVAGVGSWLGSGSGAPPFVEASLFASADIFRFLTILGGADIADAVWANNAAGGGAVSFASEIIPGLTKLQGAELEIRRDLAIYGPGANLFTIDGDNRSSVFKVTNGATAFVQNLAIENGLSETGAGILVESGANIELEAVSLAGNSASGNGGGIAVLSGGAYLSRSSLVNNSAEAQGGAIFSQFGSDGAQTTVVIDTSTLSANSAGSKGGALSIAGDLWIDSSALVANSSPAGAPTLFMEEGAVGHLVNSIFSESGENPIELESGAIVESGGNNISDSLESVVFSQSSDQVDTDPMLSALALNGGSTFSHAPQPFSPVINAGATNSPPAIDQPGSERVRGGVIDIGPVEVQNEPPVLTCPLPVELECVKENGAGVKIEAWVEDPDGDSLSIVWKSGETILFSETIAVTPGVPSKVELESVFPLGETIVMLVVGDAYTSVSCSASVKIQDTVVPVITLAGESLVNIACGSIYSDLGASAKDDCDTSVEASVYSTTLPSLEAVALSAGNYEIVYRAVDSAGEFSEAKRTIIVTDEVPPSITVPTDFEVETSDGSCGAYVDFALAQVDDCSSIDSVVYSIAANPTYPDGIESIQSPFEFSVGKHKVVITAKDSFGNESSDAFSVTVVDKTPPVLTLVGPDEIVLECGVDDWLDPSVIVSDTCTVVGGIDVKIFSGELLVAEIDVSSIGIYTVVYSAVDLAGNVGTVTRSVSVVDTTAPVFDFDLPDVTLPTEAGECGVSHEFAVTATDKGESEVSITYDLLPSSAYPDGIEDIGSVYEFTPIPGPDGTWLPHEVRYTATDISGNSESASFFVTVTDEFKNCINNISWPNALPLAIDQSAKEDLASFGEVQQFLALTDQARWYRFNVRPGSKVTIVLTELTADYNIVVYRDINAEYERMFNLFNSPDPEEQELALLGIEFAPESFSPESFSPESFSPESFSPESFSPESFSPESFSPESFSPESFSPESFSPESFSPESFSPESFSPESFSPESFSPESFSPESFSPESFSPESFSPESFSPESFSAAQMTSMIGFSAFPGLASEGVSINTFTHSGEFYVRVRGSNGAFSKESPFKLSVSIESELCEGVLGASELGESTLPEPVAGDFETIVVWDSERMFKDLDAQSQLEFQAKLEAFAVRPDVKGVLVDVSDEGRVAFANDQADENPTCPYAKNLVASEIKTIIDRWKQVNPDLRYVVLLGSDDIIPFFRTTDEAFLANEANYVPPVKDSTHSQSSLRFGQILTQDPYGSGCELNLVTGVYPYPKLAVGRLVESVEEIGFQLDNFLDLDEGAVIETRSGLVTGYDFLDDAARAIHAEFETALGVPVDSLISDASLSPEEGWTAAELSNILLSTRHDLIFLAGHFSTGSALAADYKTRLTASQVAESSADFLNSLIFSVGCHAGYNTVDGDAIDGITKQPDWAQALGRKGATLIAGTGYQYGDTEFIEYSERLYFEFALQLRTGEGPVAIGEALNAAKRKYLAETPLMRGIHEKSLLQATLFGFPMLKVNVAGARLEKTFGGTELGIVPTLVAPYSASFPGAGNSLGLETSDITIFPDLKAEELQLDVVGSTGETVVAHWFEGRNGVVTNPAEPVRPLEIYGVSVDNTLLRGVGFRGGKYEDISDFLPLTGAPATEIRGVHGNFFSDVFYPIQPYTINYLGTVCGGEDGEMLNVYPTQFIANTNGVWGGTLRKYGEMDFRLYYSSNRETWLNTFGGQNYFVIPALAPAPTIAKVSSSISEDETSVEFEVYIVGAPAAGIHEAWVSYTIVAPTNPEGEWIPLDLVQSSVDSTLWTASLPLGAMSPSNIRYMVQAASGTGLVSLRTNLGQYFSVQAENEQELQNTHLNFLDPTPSGGIYGTTISLSAKLVDDGNVGLGGRRVGLRLGTSKTTGTTDSNGVVSFELTLTTRPGEDLILQAYFEGDQDYEAGAASLNLEVVKQSTELSFIDPPSSSSPVLGSGIVVKLSDAAGTPMKERTVFFLIDYGTTEVGHAVITDLSGRADLAEVFLPAGNATITAYFNDIVLPYGEKVVIGDELYFPAEPVSITVALGSELPDAGGLLFDAQSVDVNYKPKSLEYSSTKMQGRLLFEVPVVPSDILADASAPGFVSASFEAKLAGEVIAEETFHFKTSGRDNDTWRSEKMSNNGVSFLWIQWSDEARFDSSLSESNGPRIATYFINKHITGYRFYPRSTDGSYTTHFPDGGPVIVVKDGEIDIEASSGLRRGRFLLLGGVLSFSVIHELKEGMVFETKSFDSSSPSLKVEVVEGVNFLSKIGNFVVRLDASKFLENPKSSDSSNLFECKLVLGEKSGVHVSSEMSFGDGLGATSWTRERSNFKQYRSSSHQRIDDDEDGHYHTMSPAEKSILRR